MNTENKPEEKPPTPPEPPKPEPLTEDELNPSLWC